MTTLDILRTINSLETLLTTIKPDNNSTQVKRIMGDNQLNISFEENHFIQFAINDYCVVFDETYFFNRLPVVTKISRFRWRYTLVMEAQGYDLVKAQYLFLGADNSRRESDFSLMGDADDFIDLVVSNINRVSSGWTKGQVIPSEYKNLTFSRENCYNALSRIAEEFETEFWIEGKVIHLTKRSNDTGFTFKHGRNKGLYEITRQNLNNSNIVTRLYAFGSEKNLPESYLVNGRRLRLPGGYNPCLISDLTCTLVDNGDGTQTFSFSWIRPLNLFAVSISIDYRVAGSTDAWQSQSGFWFTPRNLTLPTGTYEFRFRTTGIFCGGQSTPVITIAASIITPVFSHIPLPYIERNIETYGIIEHTEIFEDIFPHRTGIVTSVNAGDPFEFTDADIDFNVNDYLLPGLAAKVVFNTGQLSGYEFELESFNNGTKIFRIQKNGDEKVLEVPSTLLRPAIGDEYVLVDIYLPQSYIDAAEAELVVRANALLVQLSEPQLAYTIVLDPVFVRRYNKILKIGDLVWIVDDELGLQRKIRVINTTRNLINEYQLQVEISDTVTPGTVQRLISAQSSTDRDVRDIDKHLLNNSILNNKVVGTLFFENLPTTNTDTGFSEVRIEDSTGKLYRRL